MALVGAGVFGITRAYFSDTETSTGNTFTAGTIDIDIDNSNPWSEKYSIGDLKPGETDYITFNIRNVGQNPVNISKKVYGFVGTTGIVSEPECTEQGGGWDNNSKACDWDAYNSALTADDDNNNIQNWIYYDLSVEVYDSSDVKIWWQTIETGDKRLVDVYNGGQYVDLGMLPVGARMFVKQSYHLAENTGNKFQGDQLTFSMEIKGEQLTQAAGATVMLENKDGAPDWNILDDDIFGTLTYNTKGATFDFTFVGKVTQSGANYTLLYAKDPWPQTGSVVLGTVTASGTDVNFSGSATPGSITNGKVWLVLTADWGGTSVGMTAWNETDYLFETGLINYEQTL